MSLVRSHTQLGFRSHLATSCCTHTHGMTLHFPNNQFSLCFHCQLQPWCPSYWYHQQCQQVKCQFWLEFCWQISFLPSHQLNFQQSNRTIHTGVRPLSRIEDRKGCTSCAYHCSVQKEWQRKRWSNKVPPSLNRRSLLWSFTWEAQVPNLHEVWQRWQPLDHVTIFEIQCGKIITNGKLKL